MTRTKKFHKKKPEKDYSVVNDFVNNVTYTKKNAKSLRTSGSYLVDLFYLTARDMDCQKLLKLCVGAWDEDPALFMALIAQVRDREKKGEVFLGRMMMKWYVLYMFFKNISMNKY